MLLTFYRSLQLSVSSSMGGVLLQWHRSAIRAERIPENFKVAVSTLRYLNVVSSVKTAPRYIVIALVVAPSIDCRSRLRRRSKVEVGTLKQRTMRSLLGNSYTAAAQN